MREIELSGPRGLLRGPESSKSCTFSRAGRLKARKVGILVAPAHRASPSVAGRPLPGGVTAFENSIQQATPPYFQLAFSAAPRAWRLSVPPHPLQTGKSSGARGRFAFWSVSGRPACALSFRACIPIVPRLGHGLAPHPAQPSGAIGHCRALLALATFSIAASSLCCGHVGKSFVCAPVCRKSTAIFAVENYLIFAV